MEIVARCHWSILIDKLYRNKRESAAPAFFARYEPLQQNPYVAAGREALECRRHLIDERASFAIETIAGIGPLVRIHEARGGYVIHVHYVAIDTGNSMSNAFAAGSFRAAERTC